MILIISNNKDQTTIEVMKWLFILKKQFIRIHENEMFEIKVVNKRIFLESQKNMFFLDDITSVWYRRGRIRFKHFQYENDSINAHMNETQYWLQDYVLKK